MDYMADIHKEQENSDLRDVFVIKMIQGYLYTPITGFAGVIGAI